MRTLFILLALTQISGCANNNWTRRDTLFEVVSDATLLIDARQTAHFRDHKTQQEGGWVRSFCGLEPTPSCSYSYFGTVIASHALISWLLPEKWRPYWQGGFVAIEVPVILQNSKLKE